MGGVKIILTNRRRSCGVSALAKCQQQVSLDQLRPRGGVRSLFQPSWNGAGCRIFGPPCSPPIDWGCANHAQDAAKEKSHLSVFDAFLQ